MNIFSGSILYYIVSFVFLIISLGLGLLLYRGTEVSKLHKAILVSLRTISLFLILLTLLNPFVEFSNNKSAEPLNIILLDKSKSSGLENRDSAINAIAKKTASENSNFTYYTFGSKLIEEIKEFRTDTTEYFKYSTNIAATLDDLRNAKDERINSISIISDGIINDGNNLIQTVSNVKAPIHYIISGDTTQKKDLSIQKLNFNKRQFVNSKSKIYVNINSYFTEKNVNVNLFENGIKIKSNPVFVTNTNSQYETVFEVSSSSQDIKKYKVEIEPEDGEITTINNSEIFYIDYVDNTIKLLIAAGSPGSDVSSLRQILNQSSNFKYDIRIQKNSNEFYEGAFPELKEYDVLILLGFPTELTSIGLLNKLKEDLNRTKISLLFINSSNISLTKLSDLKEYLPFVYNETGKNEIKSSVVFTNNNLKTFTQSSSMQKLLPPSFFYRGAFSSKPNSTVLGIQNNEPAIIIDNTSLIKSAAFLGYGFYKWNLSPNGNYDYLKSLFSDLISLCVNENSKEKFTITSNKDSYAISEPVEFLAYYRDSDPGKKYSVKLNITGKDKNRSLELSRLGENSFQGQVQIFEKSDFNAEADLYEDNVKIQSKGLKFTVSDAVNEFKETKANEKILKEISKLSGGLNLSGKSQSELDSIFKSQSNLTNISTSKSLFRNSLLYLILIIVLLSIEWFIRKRLNLA